MAKTVVKYIRIPEDLWHEIECFMRQSNYRTIVEAMTELMRRGLAMSKMIGQYDPGRCDTG